MARPTVLVATTDPAMAYALQAKLDENCRKHGLKLEVCPDGSESDIGNKVRAYDSAEALFDALEKRDPMDLADTLVVLDVGAHLENAFKPKASSGNWHVTENRAGVAVELLLRFPQVFPVFLSPAVPCDGRQGGEDEEVVQWPHPKVDCSPGNWKEFGSLRDLLHPRHKGKEKSESELVRCFDQLFALQIPLHFVSPLDQGQGLKSTLKRFSHGMRCWFDPTGLRTLVRNYFLGTLFGSSDNWSSTWKKSTTDKPALREVLLERLDHVAVAVDEEREFAMLNAYAAYKFGRRSWMVTTFAEFDDKPLWAWQGEGDQLDVVVLRDLDLRFPDIPDKENARGNLKSIHSDIWKSFSGEDAKKDRLSDQWRVRVVSSNQTICDGELWCPEQRRLGENLGQYLGLPKPISTLYELKKLMPKETCDVVSVISRISPVVEESIGGHGAPYLNLAMAESLLLQSRRCDKGPIAHLIGALMAGEAQELLLGMSRTTSLEALLLQHKYEVMAEVEFPGVSHAIDIEPRKKDVEAVLQQYTRDNHDLPMKNMYLSQFWSELKIAYRNGEQFTAAEAANARSLVHARWWPWKLFERHDIFELKDNLSLKMKSAVVKVATSLRWWGFASFFASLLFAVFYVKLNERTMTCDILLKTWYRVVLAMVQMQFNEPKSTGETINYIVYPAEGAPWWAHPLAITHIGFSYLMFGILVSMIYRKVTRS